MILLLSVGVCREDQQQRGWLRGAKRLELDSFISLDGGEDTDDEELQTNEDPIDVD